MSVIPEKRRRKAEINIIPLVDVLIVLIFFFLLSMQFRNVNTLNISMPKIETAGKNVMTNQISIAVSPEGTFYYNDKEVTVNQLDELVKTASHLPNKKDITILLIADEDSSLKYVTTVMDICRKYQMDRIQLQSR
jgi:biopolymer transport protein ExbD